MWRLGLAEGAPPICLGAFFNAVSLDAGLALCLVAFDSMGSAAFSAPSLGGFQADAAALVV